MMTRSAMQRLSATARREEGSEAQDSGEKKGMQLIQETFDQCPATV